MKGNIKLIIFGVILNVLLIMSLVYKGDLKYFKDISLSIKILSIFIYFIYYIFLINYNVNGINKKVFGIMNKTLKSIIILGFFNLCMMISFISGIIYSTIILLSIIISFGTILVFYIIVIIDNGIIVLFTLLFAMFLSISNVIIFFCLWRIINNIYEKSKIYRIFSIIYSPIILYMIINGIEFLKKLIIFII